MICWFKMNDWTSVLPHPYMILFFLSKLSWAIWPFCVLLTYKYFSNTWGRCDTLVASPSLAPTQRESSPRDQPAIADWGIEDPRTSYEKIILQFSLFREESSHNFTIITDRRIEDPRTTSQKNYSSIFPLHIISPSLQTGELKIQEPPLKNIILQFSLFTSFHHHYRPDNWRSKILY